MVANTFDTMVGSLNENERTALLIRLQSVGKKERISLESQSGKLPDIGGGANAEEKFKTESFFLRFWLCLKSFFKNMKVADLYNEYRLHEIALKIEKNYPLIIDVRMHTFGERMYEKIYNLKKTSDFFSDAISMIQDDPGEFYMFLGIFFIPDLSEHFDKEINPSKIELPVKLSSEVKVSLQHKLDDLLGSIDAAKKNSLYEVIQSIDWLTQFCALPYIPFLNHFGKGEGSKICPIGDAKVELNDFARVLCNGKVIPNALMEAVAVYTSSEKTAAGKNITDAKHIQQEFLKKALPHLGTVKQFMDAVPLRAIGALTYDSIDWSPPRPQGSEDWFVKFKARWKKYFDTLWSRRVAQKQKAEIVILLKAAFDITSMPLLPVRPWRSLWGGIFFEHEYTLGFLHFFYQNLYPVFEPVIKTLVIEGIFIKKENGVQLAEIMREFARESSQIELFLENLSDTGIYGAIFQKSSTSTAQSQQKINSLMQRINTEAASIVRNFFNYCPQALDIFKGIISETKNPRYESISNLFVIQGIENEEFKKKIVLVRSDLGKFFELLGRIQTIPSDQDVENTNIEDDIQSMESDTIDAILFPEKTKQQSSAAQNPDGK